MTIKYQAVGPEGAVNVGSVDSTSETIKVITGEAEGSTATAAVGYTFMGWYSDKECTVSVGSDAKFVPTKNSDGAYVAATYYAKFEENDATITYVVVGPEGCGSVNPTSETIKVITGTAKGSTAAASSNVYKFVGWFDNANCSGDPISTDAKYVPTKAAEALWANTAYYAKFEYNLTDLTISKTGWQEIDENQSFIFDVYHGNTLITTVVIHRTGTATIKDLTVGETYRVVERETWSWRYKASNADQSFTLKPPGSDNTVKFENSRVKALWLNGCAAAKNIFGSFTGNANNY